MAIAERKPFTAQSIYNLKILELKKSVTKLPVGFETQ
jgi:hypothetical protein